MAVIEAKDEKETKWMKLVIEYPELLPDALQQTRAEFEQDAKMAMVAKLYELRRLQAR